MKTALKSEASQYLDQVRDLLADMSEDERDEVLLDLNAHLADLEEGDLETVLGTPAEFVAEFRESAGLDSPQPKPSVLRRLRRQIRIYGDHPLFSRLTDIWGEVRPGWVLVRGWVLAAALAVASGAGVVFTRFPIPRLSGSSWFGLVMTVLFTALSIYLARGRSHKWLRRGDLAFTAGTVLLVFLAVTSGPPLVSMWHYGFDQQVVYVDSADNAPAMLVGPEGPIGNIFAYNEAGEPVEVLLFDQDGTPLATLPEWAYEEYVNSGSNEPFIWEGYEIRFRTTNDGRPVPNLYPLQRLDWMHGEGTFPESAPVVIFPPFESEGAEDPEIDEPDPAPVPGIPVPISRPVAGR